MPARARGCPCSSGPPARRAPRRRLLSCGESLSEILEVVDVAPDVLLAVLHGERPVLALAPRRHEHAAVELHEPVDVRQLVRHLEVLAIVADALAAVGDRAAAG